MRKSSSASNRERVPARHDVVLLVASDGPLSKAARHAISKGHSFLSTAAYWEVVTKSQRRKLEVGDPRIWWHAALRALQARVVPITPEHVDQLIGLQQLHRDPFDRILVAQALCEGLTLVTRVEALLRYKIAGLSVVPA